jgi:hypothetical protein
MVLTVLILTTAGLADSARLEKLSGSRKVVPDFAAILYGG